MVRAQILCRFGEPILTTQRGTAVTRRLVENVIVAFADAEFENNKVGRLSRVGPVVSPRGEHLISTLIGSCWLTSRGVFTIFERDVEHCVNVLEAGTMMGRRLL